MTSHPSNTQPVALAATQPVAPTDGSPFDMAMRKYEAAAITCGAGRNNAQVVDAAADRVFALYNAKPPSAPVGDRNWHEDATHENGEYQNRCVTCGSMFIGHKRRVVCRVCAKPSAPVGVKIPPRKNERDSDGKFRTIYLFDTPHEQGQFQRHVEGLAQHPAPVAPAGVEGTWLWCKLMDWCKEQRLAPATQDKLFAIAGEAHKLNKLAKQPAAVDDVEGLKRLVRHLAGNPNFDFEAALAPGRRNSHQQESQNEQ